MAVLRALRAGPVSPRSIAERTGLSAQVVYRTLAHLVAAGAPIEEGQVQAEVGRPTRTYRLTVDGLRAWVG